MSKYNQTCGYGRDGPGGSVTTCFTEKEITSFLSARCGDDDYQEPIGKTDKYKKLIQLLDVTDDDGIMSKLSLDPNLYRKPPMPELLLSNEDIDYILTQYESAHPGFKSFGSVPYDFSTSPPGPWKGLCDELRELNWGIFLKSHSSFGMVVNLDTHENPGNHWVCVYATVSGTRGNKGLSLEYFDSLGTSVCRSFIPKCNKQNIPYRIHTLFTRLSKSFSSHTGSNKGCDTTISYNNDSHQKKNNECGMYCLYYIYNRLNGIAYQDGVHTISDDKMTYFRNVLFDHSSNICKTCRKLTKSFKESVSEYGTKPNQT